MSFLQKASRSPGLRLVITPWSTRLFQPLLGHHQLRLLEAVGSEDANSLVFDPWKPPCITCAINPQGHAAVRDGNCPVLEGPGRAERGADRRAPTGGSRAHRRASRWSTHAGPFAPRPPKLSASWREPSASVEHGDRNGVPSAMAKVAVTPAQQPLRHREHEHKNGSIQGLMPTENTTAMTFRHDNGPASCRASTM